MGTMSGQSGHDDEQRQRRRERQRRRRRARRRFLPEPPQPAREGWLARLRRRTRRKVVRAADRAINALYSLAAWLDHNAPAERRYFRVAIFGSSRVRRDDATYREVCELARELSLMGCDIVTGGGPGLMTAANEGARLGAYRHHTRSFGLAILLPIEEQPNPFLDEEVHHKTFFSRLHQFLRLSHAYVVVDGGIGTTLEAFMVWQLLQIEGLEERPAELAARPLIFVGEMWAGLRGWVEAEVVARGLASPRDLEMVHWVESTAEAVEIVRGARDRFLERNEILLPPPDTRREDGGEESAGGTAEDEGRRGGCGDGGSAEAGTAFVDSE